MIDTRLNALDSRLVGRSESLFTRDLAAAWSELGAMLRGSRVLFIGAAGSIGSNTLRTVANFRPAALHVIDHNENGLAELVRMLRSSQAPLDETDLLTLPFDYGGDPFRLWLRSQSQGYDYILNFAALKHVRSEKDPYSILAMLETNVLKLERLSELMRGSAGLKRLFCVSTDKAANPSSMMGATKRLMEHALFSPRRPWPADTAVTSARFANVALSNGSLLQSWQIRLESRQPMACPEGCRRFFVALPESGHLCTLAGLLGEDRTILIPALHPEEHLVLLQDAAGWFLEAHGFTPYFTRDQDEAMSRVEELAAQGRWPVLLTPLDTAGEKPYEEFTGEGEASAPTRFEALHQVSYLPPLDPDAFPALLERLWAFMGSDGAGTLTLDHIKSEIASVEAGFARSHVASDKSLDHRF